MQVPAFAGKHESPVVVSSYISAGSQQEAHVLDSACASGVDERPRDVAAVLRAQTFFALRDPYEPVYLSNQLIREVRASQRIARWQAPAEVSALTAARQARAEWATELAPAGGERVALRWQRHQS